MAVKAGTAFVDFEGDFSELNKQVSGHFNKLSSQAGETGKKAGDALGDSMNKQVGGHFAKLSQKAGDAGKRAGSAFSGAMKLGAGAAGATVGGLFMKGLTDAIDAEKANSKLAAQLGTSKATSKKMGKIAGKVYADAYGDSLSQVNDAIRGLVQNDIAKKTGNDVEDLTKKTLNLASAFDQDVGDATRGVGQLLRTGLVKDADQAFDVITKGFQKGGDKAGDLIDTLNEYSTQWRKLGLNAEEATGLITQGLRAGARDSDIVADSLKEFSLRATGSLLKMTKTADGPKASLTALGEAFKAAGFDANSADPKIAALADRLQRDIAGGGEKAQKGLQIMLDGLRKTTDPLERSRNAVALFGTQAEDLGAALYALDPSKAVQALGKVDGAAQKLGDTLNNNTAARFEELKRKTFASFQGAAAKYVLPEFDKILKIINDPNLTTSAKFDKIGQRLSDAISAATPVVTEAAKQVAPAVAKGFIEGFLQAPAWAKMIAGGWLLKKFGGLSSFQAVGSTAGGGMATGVSSSFGSKAGLLMKTVGKNVLAAAVIAGVGEGFAVAGQDLSLQQKFESWFNGMTLGTVGVNWTKKFADIQAQIMAGAKPPEMDPGFFNANPFKDLKPVDWEHYINNEGFNEEQKKLLIDFKKVHDGAVSVAADLAKRGIVIDVKLIHTQDALDGAKRVRDAIDLMARGGSNDVSSLRTNVRLNMRAIRRNMGNDSAAAKEAISANFSAAIQNIKTSMHEGTISVKAGTALIQEYMVKSLMNFGFSHEQALNVARDPKRRTSFTGGPEEGTRGVGKQRGGYINLGAPSGDSVHAMLERDEYVLNRKAVRKVGKTALDRLNFGSAPRFQKGGSVTGDTDFLPTLMNALKALSASVGVPIFVQSGRRTVAEQLAQGPSTPSHPVAGPNGPHVRGVAADITPGFPVFGNAAGKFGLGFTVMPQEPWHIQLIDAAAAAGAQAVSTVAEKIAGVKVSGPDSALKSIAQGAIDATQGPAQDVINQVAASMAPPGGSMAGPSSPGKGAASRAQMVGWATEALTKTGIFPASTGNIEKILTLAMKESSWVVDALNTTDINAKAGNPSGGLMQVTIDKVGGSYARLYDPVQNMMASIKYQKERYGDLITFSPYAKGGLVGGLMALLQPGGRAPNISETHEGTTNVKPVKHDNSKAAKKVKDRIAKHLAKIGFGADQDNLDALAQKVLVDESMASRLSSITDTEAIQAALDAEMTKRGATSDMTEAQQLALFPAAEQDAMIQQLRPTLSGLNQGGWLNRELEDMLAQRNILIDEPAVLAAMKRQTEAEIKLLKDSIDRVEAQIKEAEAQRKKVIALEEKKQKAISTEKKKKKPDAKRLALLRRQESALHSGGRSELTAAEAKTIDNELGFEFHHSRVGYNNILSDMRAGNKVRSDTVDSLTDSNDDGVPSLSNIKSATESVFSTMDALQGPGSPWTKMFSDPQPLGILGPSILDVQKDIRDLTTNPPRAVASAAAATAPGESEGEKRTKEILAELLKEANQRTAVSQAQYDVFSNLPDFGGSFKEGGTVPGPIGAARMIMAHGGEVVIPNDASYSPGVTLNFANGMEWLRQFVSVQVDSQTRAQGRRSERQLPGQPGLLR
jgi:hypothetical protein